ncbi:SpoIIE family protein phosphatase, partial [Candidatus Saccharibacteria bacterium]|nr:SpoIIE family protein phosphatase [Candidatus Saccharibacteria bacterium]
CEPLRSREVVLESEGLDAAEIARIQAGDKTAFKVLDLRQLPIDAEGGRLLMPGVGRRFRADYLLTVADFRANADHGIGYKAVNIGQNPVRVGRMHYQDRFTYDPAVSRDQFELSADENGFVITNLNPRNGTTVTYVPKTDRAEAKIGTIERSPVKDSGVAEYKLHGEDANLVVPETGLFGVFDGAGGGGGDPAMAAHTAARHIKESVKQIDSVSTMADALDAASEKVAQATSGVTTAALGKIVEKDGAKTLIWTSSGDSRIYVVSGDNQNLKQINYEDRDLGFMHRIHEFLGSDEHGNAKKLPRKSKYMGELQLHDGEKIIFCSDGVTGDVTAQAMKQFDLPPDKFKVDEMTDEEMLEIIREGGSADEIAKRLVARAKKHDDRTAVVVEV